MFGSTILDVAIGMVFVYLLISLICSALNELIEAKLKYRAKDLEKGITNLLGDPGLVQKLYTHPLVKALYKPGDKPSYIPAQTFSLALWNLATYAQGAQEGKDAAVAVTRSLPEIRKAVAGLPDEGGLKDLKQALLTLMDEAGDDLDRARRNVERWYDDAMDRASGWYKRRTQWILLALGLAFAVALNVDSLRIANQLFLDTPKREAIVAAAQGYAAAAVQKDQQQPADAIKANYARISQLGFPLGWSRQDFPADGSSGMDWLGVILLKLLGLLATALAVSLGAPFWFDVLNKFMVVRSTIKPHEKSGETPSKDKAKAPEAPAPPEGGEPKPQGAKV